MVDQDPGLEINIRKRKELLLRSDIDQMQKEFLDKNHYKLIWSEYIQKPANDMLDFILPQRDCPGIYKITNDKNKKAYIGRSTSVRKRLIDHIKSTVGISTIADQQVHKAMREEGLWNFKFELIETCEKTQLGEREKYYIDFFKTQSWGYNAIGGSAFKGD